MAFNFDEIIDRRTTNSLKWTQYPDVFRASPQQLETVTVRFAPSVARWVRERYREVEDQDDGGVTVQLPATSTQWLVRRVLEYGDDAEVIGPAAYREAVRRAVA